MALTRDIYRQCELSRKIMLDIEGEEHESVEALVTWLPRTYARVGLVLQLKRNDVWENGWRVSSVGWQDSWDHLIDAHSARKAHRKNTGDSEPKVST